MKAKLKTRHVRPTLAAAAAIAPLLVLAPAGTARADAPLTWTFDKCATKQDGVWKGTATLDTTEKLRTELTSASQSGQILHVTFDWEVGNLFLAPLSGTLNLDTGAVVMNGTITEGAYAGSNVHEEGQLYDAENSCFAGTLTVQPATG